jgi:hypothetical protein
LQLVFIRLGRSGSPGFTLCSFVCVFNSLAFQEGETPLSFQGCYSYNFDYNRRRELLETLQMAALNAPDPLHLRQGVERWKQRFDKEDLCHPATVAE